MNKVIHKGKFITYKLKDDKYEYVSREGTNLAVAIISSKRVPLYTDVVKKYQLILNKRPTFDNPILEFPAGIVDEGDCIDSAALRELKEETGWGGKVTKISPPCTTSAGLTDEMMYFVFVNLTEKEEPTDKIEDKHITILPLMTQKEIKEYIGYFVGAVSKDVYTYFIKE